MEDQLDKTPPELKFRNKKLRELLDEESALDDNDNEDLDAEELKRRKQSAERQRAIDALPLTLDKLLDEIANQTGLLCSIFLVGPEPQQGGNDICITLHKGHTHLGGTIANVYPTACEAMQTACVNFSARIFPPETRRMLASPGTEHLSPKLTIFRPTNPINSTAPQTHTSLDPNPNTQTAEAMHRPPAHLQDGETTVRKRMEQLDQARARNYAVAMRLLGDGSVPLAQHKDHTAVSSTSLPATSTTPPVASTSPAAPPVALMPPATSASAPHPTTSESLEDVPAWLTPFIPRLQSLNNTAWQELLKKFLVMERLLGCVNGRGKSAVLRAHGRPEAVGIWIKYSRGDSPKIADLLSFKTKWKGWWFSLQPRERQGKGMRFTDLSRSNSRMKMDWTELSKGSINGFFNIIISLSWWLKAVLGDDEESADVGAAIQDVGWVVEQITSNLQGGAKRGADESEAPDGRDKRQKAK